MRTQELCLKKSVVIGILGSTRSGTSHAFSSLYTSLGPDNIIDLGETFSPWTNYEQRKKKRSANKHESEWTSNKEVLKFLREKTQASNYDEMLSKIRESPGKGISLFVEIYEKLYGKRIFILKIFEEHLQDCGKSLAKATFKHFDAVLFFKRNFFESYVSMKIAQNKGVWSGVDTSKDRVEVDYDDMMWTYRIRVAWEYEIQKVCQDLGVPKRTIEYENFYGSERSEIDKSKDLFDIVCSIAGVAEKDRDYEILEERVREKYASILKKQNKNKNILDSIEEEHKERFIHFLERWRYDVK